MNNGAVSIPDRPLRILLGMHPKTELLGHVERKPQSGEMEAEERPEGVVGAVTGAGESRSA